MRKRVSFGLLFWGILAALAVADDSGIVMPLDVSSRKETPPSPAAPAETVSDASPLPTPPPEPRPKPAKPTPAKTKPKPGEMTPVDDIPGGKLYVAAAGKAPIFRCFVRDVMAFYDRTHIRCYNKARGKLNFFAVDTNQPVAATLLDKGLAAMQSGKPVTITFAPGADLNPSNCDRANCRRLIDIRE